MKSTSRTYLAIDLKSFYASVECVDRGVNPLTTNLVVADATRTEKTICLAVSPSLKAYGIGGRARLFEVVQRVRQVNAERRRAAGHSLTGKSVYDTELKAHPDWEVDYIVAPPRMGHYITYSTRIYEVYLKYVAPEDIHVYSIDEVFIDVTNYLKTLRMTAHELAMTMIRDVLATTGITATAGIGTNMYLAKVAMDIVAKHLPADKDGVRIAELDEQSYREQLWEHTPLTDFWRIGRGIAAKLQANGMCTMGDVARMSMTHENLLYKLFGVNAELLIDHAWGYEPVTMEAVKAYRPETRSLSSGQVLTEPYTNKKAAVVVREMAENIALDLLDKHLVADQFVLTVGYDIANLTDPAIRAAYRGDIVTDHYGRHVPKHSQGTANLAAPTFSAAKITEAVCELFARVANPLLLVRRLTIAVNHVVPEESLSRQKAPLQLDLFTDYEELARRQAEEQAALDKERRLMEATLALKNKFGKNSVLKGVNYGEGATQRERNRQIGGHKA
ncbi:MAG: DNA methylase [Muribaculaceae bacterium]|nr:DNA methylase [Muribaculaceae bacterium]